MPESFWSVMRMNRLEGTEDYERFQASGGESAWVGIAPLRPESTVIWQEDARVMYCYYRGVYDKSRLIGVIKCGISAQKLFSSVSRKRERRGDLRGG